MLYFFRIVCLFCLSSPLVMGATLEFQLLGYSPLNLQSFFAQVEKRTSIASPDSKLTYLSSFNAKKLKQPWVFAKRKALLLNKGQIKKDVWKWIVRGGFAVVVADEDQGSLEDWTTGFQSPLANLRWSVLDSTSELSKSFYLMKSLPACENTYWYGMYLNNRLALVVVPYDILRHVSGGGTGSCSGIDVEMSIRSLINSMMIALTTDYKNDQIHLPAILKRIR